MIEKNSRIFRLASIILAYIITLAGLIAIPFVFAISKSWWLGFFCLLVFIPVFPALQAILVGQRAANLLMFLKIYVAEYTSLSMQLLFLLVTAPFIAIAIAGVLPIMMLVVVVLMWPIVGLQQVGIEIGSKLPAQDIEILFWIMLVSLLLTGIYFVLHKLAKKYAKYYFEIWAHAFSKVRDFYRYG